MLIKSLEERNYHNIIIIDNQSTYPPLLKYYKETSHKVIFLNENLGYNALEKIPLYKKIRKNYFVYTDPDVIPIKECPDDFLKSFLDLLKTYPKVQKVGFSLKIDDLPDHFESKEKVINWETQFYSTKLDDNNYLAPIDTTFALHRPYALISLRGGPKMIRTKYPLTAKHMPWYNDTRNLSNEEKFYIKNVQIGTHWSKGIEIKQPTILNKIKLLKRLL